jgi:hypothetical protein
VSRINDRRERKCHGKHGKVHQAPYQTYDVKAKANCQKKQIAIDMCLMHAEKMDDFIQARAVIDHIENRAVGEGEITVEEKYK